MKTITRNLIKHVRVILSVTSNLPRPVFKINSEITPSPVDSNKKEKPGGEHFLIFYQWEIFVMFLYIKIIFSQYLGSVELD